MSFIHRRWHISSLSGGGNCVEVRQEDGTVYVRHSKRREEAMLEFDEPEWLAFLAGVRRGEFNLHLRVVADPVDGASPA